MFLSCRVLHLFAIAQPRCLAGRDCRLHPLQAGPRVPPEPRNRPKVHPSQRRWPLPRLDRGLRHQHRGQLPRNGRIQSSSRRSSDGFWNRIALSMDSGEGGGLHCGSENIILGATSKFNLSGSQSKFQLQAHTYTALSTPRSVTSVRKYWWLVMVSLLIARQKMLGSYDKPVFLFHAA